MKRIVLGLAIILAGISSAANAAVVFEEGFGTLADGVSITTSNSAFNYVRIGNGGGSITATAGSPFGGSAMNLGGSDSGSLNGVGIGSGLGNHNTVAMHFSLNTGNASLGDLIISSGSGSSFTGNGGFNTSQLFFALQIDNGNLEYRTSSWQNTGFTVNNNTDYNISVFANNSGSILNHSFGSVANGSMDIVINGTVISDDVAIAGNQDFDAFRMYQVRGEQRYTIDNIRIHDSFSAVPEPGSVMVLSLFGFGAAAVRRRRS